MKEGAYMGADFRFLSRSQQKEMEIKRDTIMTSYFKEMTLGFFIITIDVKTTVLLSIIYLHKI